MQRNSSVDTICSKMQTIFQEPSSRKTVSFKEQIMSKDKCRQFFYSIVILLEKEKPDKIINSLGKSTVKQHFPQKPWFWITSIAPCSILSHLNLTCFRTLETPRIRASFSQQPSLFLVIPFAQHRIWRGIISLGIVNTSWAQISSEKPKNKLHIHWSHSISITRNAFVKNCTIMI